MKRILLVGLGNPGKRYERTRHNLGIRALRHWVETQTSSTDSAASWQADAGQRAETAAVRFADTIVTCLFPLTSMNRSGEAVAAFNRRRFGILPAPYVLKNLLVIHDDIELPLGKIRFKQSGSAAGHKGVRSIQHALQTQDFPRLRLGISKPAASVDQYVLEPFSPAEEPTVALLLTDAAAAITQFIQSGGTAF